MKICVMVKNWQLQYSSISLTANLGDNLGLHMMNLYQKANGAFSIPIKDVNSLSFLALPSHCLFKEWGNANRFFETLIIVDVHILMCNAGNSF